MVVEVGESGKLWSVARRFSISATAVWTSEMKVRVGGLSVCGISLPE